MPPISPNQANRILPLPIILGLEYRVQDLAFLIPEDDETFIGLAFKRNDLNENSALDQFIISRVYYDHSLATPEFTGIESPVEISHRLLYKESYQDEGYKQLVGDENRALENFTFPKLQFFQEDFGFCLFFKAQLQAMFNHADKIIISGMLMNFGTMAFPKVKLIFSESDFDEPAMVDMADREIPITSIFTLKAEAKLLEDTVNSDSFTSASDFTSENRNILALVNPDPFGIPIVAVGLPCPPYWIRPDGGEESKIGIVGQYISNIVNLKPEKLTSLTDPKWLDTIKSAWDSFVLKTNHDIFSPGYQGKGTKQEV